MITKPIEGGFKQICATSDHIYGLDHDGNVYYREKAPTSYSSFNNSPYYADKEKKEAAEEKKAWKKLFMEYKVELPKGGPERSAQPANEPEQPVEQVDVLVDEPAHKVYKDVETIKRVQQALMDKDFYKKTNKIDGDLGKLTVDGIKAFQKSVNLRETGEIDLTLCNALGLNKPSENETVVEAENEPTIELSTGDIVEEDDEVYCGA